jgi:SSS family solute:Na+ symporter
MQIGSAKDAHEAKMMRVIGVVRQLAMLGLGLFLLPYAAFVILHHPDFAAQADKIQATVGAIANPQVRSQMLVPTTVAGMLPKGLMGAFTGVVMFAFIACHSSYLLAWGGIVVQDVVMPLYRRPLRPKVHIWLLRLAILFSATFTVVWSALFQQVDDIFMYFDITAGIYLSGAGVVILGGMYWRRGTTMAAWIAMITGSVLAASSFIYRSYNPEFLNSRILAFLSICVSVLVYVVASYLTKNPNFDLDRMLNRTPEIKPKRKWEFFGEEFSKFDRRMVKVILVCISLYFAAFAIVTAYNLTHEVSNQSWLKWWRLYFYIMFAGGVVFLTWITIGGIRDLIRMFRMLKTEKTNDADDGHVGSLKTHSDSVDKPK